MNVSDRMEDTNTGSSNDKIATEEESKEAKKNKGLSCGIKPSQKEVEEHERTHLPFRSWCKHCVIGRAQSHPHYKQEEEECQVPTISWDYMFLSEEDESKKKRKTEEEQQNEAEEGLPIVIWADSMSKGAMAYMVPNKGECEYAIKRGVQDVTKVLGYNKMVFRGDQEPALKTMVGRIKS